MKKKNIIIVKEKKEPLASLIISDPHVGSAFGMMPRGFHTKNGNEIRLNPIQNWLMNKWELCEKWFYKYMDGDPYILIGNGDLIDGDHHNSSELWSTVESDHGIAAYHLLKNLSMRADSVFLTEGTEVHTKDHEHSIAYQLRARGANVVMPKGTGGAWATLDIEIAGTYCKFDHHIASSTRPHLEASALSIAMGCVRQECARAGHRIPKVIARAHRHKFGEFCDGYGRILVTPPWQAITRYGRKVVPHAIIQVGFVVLDWRGKPRDSVPTLENQFFTVEQSPIIKV